ncbi:MAG: hypothetical protein K8H88_11950 [Sandaracinaceae bacterium]|nr:hypothetical protein [Sandaracinaceae bacterium]
MLRRLLVILSLSLLFVSPALAQTRVRESGFREREVVDDSLLRQGRMEAGLSLAGSWSMNSVRLDTGETQSQHSLYAVPSLVGGYMVLDWLELRATLGLQYIGSGIGGGREQNNFAGVLTVQALAQVDFGLGVGGYAGLGLGGYYGWRSQPTATPGVKAAFGSAGGIGQVLVGLLVQPGASLMFRGGLRLDALLGAEWPDNPGLGLTGADTFNAVVVAELTVSWRFH